MIQRIQSLYLLLSGIGIFGLFKLPMASSSVTTSSLFADGLFNLFDSDILMMVGSAAGAMLICSIFLFKNRVLQSRVTLLALLLILIFIGLAFYTLNASSGLGMESINASLGSALPIISLILGLLANRGIQKDQDIVKSMDRLR